VSLRDQGADLREVSLRDQVVGLRGVTPRPRRRLTWCHSETKW
jgi:hypothetical protein